MKHTRTMPHLRAHKVLYSTRRYQNKASSKSHMKPMEDNTTTGSASPGAAHTSAARPPEKLLTAQRLACILGLSRREVEKWTRKKILPTVKVGRCRRYEPARVLVALEQYEKVVAADREESLVLAFRRHGYSSVFGALTSFRFYCGEDRS